MKGLSHTLTKQTSNRVGATTVIVSGITRNRRSCNSGRHLCVSGVSGVVHVGGTVGVDSIAVSKDDFAAEWQIRHLKTRVLS